MSLFRTPQASQMRGLLRHSQRAGGRDTLGASQQRSQGYRDLRVHRQSEPARQPQSQRAGTYHAQRPKGYSDLRAHRQSDRSWRPPPARNDHLRGQSAGSSHARFDAGKPSETFGRIRTDTRGGARGTPGAAGASGASGGGYPLSGMLLSYADLERALERRGLTAVRFLLGLAGGLTVFLGLMWPRIKRWGGAQGAEVAAASLQQEELKSHAAALVNALLADPRTTQQVETMLKQALVGILADPDVKLQASRWAADVMEEAMMWPGVVRKGTEYVETVLADEQSVENAYGYFAKAAEMTVRDDKVLDAASSVSCRLLFWLASLFCFYVC